jgi:hypothetical protein
MEVLSQICEDRIELLYNKWNEAEVLSGNIFVGDRDMVASNGKVLLNMLPFNGLEAGR